MEKVKVNLVVKGDIISNGCISSKIVEGGGMNLPCYLM